MKQSGFTLVELMVTVVIAGFLMTMTYATYTSQQRSQVAQDQVGEMQQNVRAAFLTMTRDIREAGCDPTQKAAAGFTSAGSDQVIFTRDIAGNAIHPDQADGDVEDANEEIAFQLSGTDLIRNDVNGVGAQVIANNLESIEFSYLDQNGNPLAPLSGSTLTLSDLNRIRAVQVSMLVRASKSDPDLPNTATYTTASGTVWGPYNDNFRRRLVTSTIQCRNKGFKP